MNKDLLRAQLLIEAADALNEKATRMEYHKRRTRKDFNYDKKTKTIELPNGKRVKLDDGNSKSIKVDTEYGAVKVPRLTMAVNDGNERIVVDKYTMGLKRNKRNALLGHEFVHNVGHFEKSDKNPTLSKKGS